MSFDLLWAPEARRDLAGLPLDVQRRIVLKVLQAARDPVRFFKQLKGEAVWSLRVGDYRVLAFVTLRARRVDVVAVGHRRNVYDR